jgi:hypothetical protein
MSESVTYRASRKKALFLLLASLAFVAIGYLMRAEQPFIAWAAMIFFGLGIALSLVMLFSPSAMYLRLDPDGFEMGSFIKKTRIKWTDVAGFELAAIRGAKMIEIVYAPHYQGQQMGRAVASHLADMEGAIANNYEVPLAELLATLNTWHARYARR